MRHSLPLSHLFPVSIFDISLTSEGLEFVTRGRGVDTIL
jgi:hypothetical protein